jgi:hypothetical protein
MASFDYDVLKPPATRGTRDDRGRYDITTGAVIGGPATQALHVYQVQDIEGSVQVRAQPQ